MTATDIWGGGSAQAVVSRLSGKQGFHHDQNQLLQTVSKGWRLVSTALTSNRGRAAGGRMWP
jgi:hypothetical protein